MTRALLLALGFASLAAPAHAQVISGPATALDGDTLEMTGTPVRLFGIDAVEGAQTCERDGAAWRCGEEARAVLASLVAGKPVRCEQRDRDADGRVVAVCRAGRIDLALAMAEAGFAVALPQVSEDYVAAVDAARGQRLGLWGATFEEPAAWRLAHPREVLAARPVRAAPVRAGVYYRNCDAVRAAGAAPLYAGQPGYRAAMDGDGDGVACEPYRGRR